MLILPSKRVYKFIKIIFYKFYGLFSVWQSVFSEPDWPSDQKLMYCLQTLFFYAKFLTQFYKKMRWKTYDFHWICWMIYVHSFRKGITLSDWNSTFRQILGKYVTSFPPFLQYFITNKCRLLPWIHPKEIIFYHFMYWI